MIKNIRSNRIFKNSEIQKIVRSKKVSNKDNKKEHKKFYIFSFVSIILIFSFFCLPSIEKYLSDNFSKNKTVLNISKKKFELTLNNKKDEIVIIDESNNLDNVYDDIDISSSNDQNINTSRLSASTLEQLFKETDYSLKKVKKTKLVNIGINLDHLPTEMKNI